LENALSETTDATSRALKAVRPLKSNVPTASHKMKSYYHATVTNEHGAVLPRIYVRKYVNSANEDVYGFGMTRKHKSCLVVRVEQHGKSAVVEGLSMFCKKTGERKNPLMLHKDHMKTWLAVADAFALFLGIKKLRLFDAANVVFPDGTFAFLSHCTLLRDGSFLYTKYGYVPDKPYTYESVMECLRRKPCDFAKQTDNASVRTMLKTCETWKEVYEKLGKCKEKYNLLENVFLAMGIHTISELQMQYSKRVCVRSSSLMKLFLNPIEPPSWLVSYSDRWMDIY
jgi:hypothetical protein